MALELENILITWSRGFIGSHLCEYLDKRNISYIHFSWDIRKKESIREFFSSQKITQIIHLVWTFEWDIDHQLELNFLATKNLLEVAYENNIKKFIFASTGAVYGEPLRDKSYESDRLFPNTFYGLFKQLSEEILLYYSRNFGVNCVILRFPNVYGEWSRWVISAFKKQIQDSGAITVFWDGKQSRNFLHVSDAIEAVYLAMKYNWTDIFNITNSKKISLNDLIWELRKYYSFEVKYAERNENNVHDLVLSWERAKKFLGFEAKQTDILL